MAKYCDCENSLSVTRRELLKASAILTFAALPELSLAKDVSETRLLVILLRGGMDGLYAVPPIGDSQLAGLRRHINPQEFHKLDGFFALHPVFGNIKGIYDQGQALLVHATSLPYTGRSHFEGQDIMETGVMRPYASQSGWLGRALDAQGFQSITMTLPIPLILRGMATRDSVYPSWLSSMPSSVYSALAGLWAGDPELSAVGNQLIEQRDLLALKPDHYVGDVNTIQTLARDAGARLKKGEGPRIAVLDHVGFDSHANEPSDATRRMKEVDEAIGEFRKAIGDDVWKHTLIVTVTEFGRTAAENGSFGTDHGWGTSIFVMGGKLKKSGIVADWPGLKNNALFEGRDLKATTDARSLYGSIVSSALEIDPERVKREILDYTPSGKFDAYL